PCVGLVARVFHQYSGTNLHSPVGCMQATGRTLALLISREGDRRQPCVVLQDKPVSDGHDRSTAQRLNRGYRGALPRMRKPWRPARAVVQPLAPSPVTAGWIRRTRTGRRGSTP